MTEASITDPSLGAPGAVALSTANGCGGCAPQLDASFARAGTA
jgi:hypothetical protein